jgi:hypothetical protein
LLPQYFDKQTFGLESCKQHSRKMTAAMFSGLFANVFFCPWRLSPSLASDAARFLGVDSEPFFLALHHLRFSVYQDTI